MTIKISNVDLRKQQFIYNLFLVKEQKNPLLILFGNGYKNQTGELVMEMEIPALICNFGLVGFVLYLGPILYLIISSLFRELKRIKEIIDSKVQVKDKKLGYRDVTYKDIVILLRSTSKLAPVYEKELVNSDIPVFSDSSNEYLDTIEIQQSFLNLDIETLFKKIISLNFSEIIKLPYLKSYYNVLNQGEILSPYIQTIFNPLIEVIESVLKDKIDDSNNAKTDLLFNLSYDLIAPMNAIVSLSDSLSNLETLCSLSTSTAKSHLNRLCKAGVLVNRGMRTQPLYYLKEE